MKDRFEPLISRMIKGAIIDRAADLLDDENCGLIAQNIVEAHINSQAFDEQQGSLLIHRSNRQAHLYLPNEAAPTAYRPIDLLKVIRKGFRDGPWINEKGKLSPKN